MIVKEKKLTLQHELALYLVLSVRHGSIFLNLSLNTG